MNNLSSLTSAQLKQAAELKDRITTLETELSALLGSAPAKIKGPKPADKPVKKKSTMSAAVRARISAAAKARWAKVKAEGKTTL